MAVNILQQVRRYADANLALLQNMYAFISTANKRFKDFNKTETGNLGDSVDIELPARFETKNSLVISFQPVVQRFDRLTVDVATSSAIGFTAQQFIFGQEEYIEKYGRSAMAEIGSQIEADVAKVAETTPFRFFGDGVNQISSYLQLANALARYTNFGSGKTKIKSYLSDLTYPSIVNSGLNQFVPARNEKEAMSWEIGRFRNCDFYQSNLLPVHRSGTVGNSAAVLTVLSVTVDPATNAVTAITFSGAAASDPNAVKQYDKFQFSDGVVGQPNIRFLTFIGYFPSSNPVQFSALADAASDPSGNVTVQLQTPLSSTLGNGERANGLQVQYISDQIRVGMRATVLPDHRCGLITSEDPIFLAMPKLPDEDPYKTATAFDKDSGASIRMYYGSQFGQNNRGLVHDCIHGKKLIAEYSMMIAQPV